jgi:transmembrane sensor
MTLKEHDESLSQSVSDHAAEWFIRLRDRDLTRSDRRKFVRWLKLSPSHISEFMRLCQLYGRVKRAKVPTLLPEQEVSNVFPLGQRELPLPEQESRPRLFGFRLVQFAAAIGGLALIGVIASMALSSNTIETRISEWRQVQFADGSLVSVGPNTLLQVEYSQGVRRILLKHGEAMFQVVKDSSRPFIVDAGDAAVRAVGTKFGVDRREESIVVTVAEGKVAVARGDRSAALENAIEAIDKSMIIALVADERVQIQTRTPTVPPRKEKVNASNALAWAKGRLIFQDETLADAVREFNRRNRIQIEVDDPTIAALTVCCVYDATDPEAFAMMVAANDAIALVREGPITLRLVPQAPGQPEAPGVDVASQ